MSSQQPTFPLFPRLPFDIRFEIWDRAAQDILKTPSVEWTNLWHLNSPSFPDHVQAAVFDTEEERAAQLARIRSFRSKHVKWDCDETRTKIGADGRNSSAWWHLKQLAEACKEDIPNALSRWWRYPESDRRRGWGVWALSFLNMSEDIIVLSGPETISLPFFLFFAYCPRRGKQLVLIESQYNQTLATHNRWDPLPADMLEKCPNLCEAWPAFSQVKRVAFVYNEGLDTAGPDRVPYYKRIGLQHLWPHNMPALQEIYLLDESIKLRPRVREPPATGRSFPGYKATYYEVDWKQGNVWNLNTPKGLLNPVFRSAAELQDKYDAVGAPVRVKVLACVPKGKDQ